ncbi:MAG: hypothetical protein JO214_01920 [Frankiaceae bacterium]|nr:hypothetical protein [Frankiaceae bacterium]
MATLLITYNLNGGDDEYKDLFKVIESCGETWHNARILDSVWFLKTAKTVAQVSDAMGEVMKANDDRFVVDISGQPRQGWMPKPFWEWLNK